MRAAVFQDAVSSSTRVFGRKAVDVVFAGTDARTDGNIVYLPSLPQSAEINLDQAAVIRGYRDHEAMHVRCTDTSQATIRELDRITASDALLGQMIQYCEDVRIENAGISEYPGMKGNLSAVNKEAAKVFLSEVEKFGDPKDVLAGMGSDMQFKVCMQALARNEIGVGSDGLYEAMIEHVRVANPKLVEFCEQWAPRLASLPTGHDGNKLVESKAKKGTADSFEMAKMVHAAYLQLFEKPPEPPPQPQPQPQPQGEKKQGGDGKGSEDGGDGKGREKDQRDDGDKGSGDSQSEKPKQEGEQDDGGQGDAGDAADDEQAGDQGAGEDPADEQDGGGDAGDQGQDPADEDPSDRGDDQQGDGGDDAGDQQGDQGGSQGQQGQPGGQDGGQSGGDGDGAPSSGSGSGGQQGDSDGSQGQGSASGPSDGDDSGGDEFAGEQDHGSGGGDIGGRDPVSGQFDLGKVGPPDFSKALNGVVGEINKGSASSTIKSVYRPFDNRLSYKGDLLELLSSWSSIHGHKDHENAMREMVQHADSHFDTLASAANGKKAMIRRILELELQARDDRRWEGGHTRGRLHSIRLVDAVQGRERVYQARNDGSDMNTVLMMSIDGSGSMDDYDGRMLSALALAYALSEALEKTGCDIEVLTWGNVCNTQHATKKLFEETAKKFVSLSDAERKQFTSVGLLARGVIKGLRERVNSDNVKRKFGAAMKGMTSGTPYWDAIFADLNDLAQLPHKKKVYLMLTDGEADRPYSGNAAALKAEYTALAVKNNIHLVGVGVAGMDVGHLFSDHISVNGPDAYEPVIKLLAKIIAKEVGHGSFRRTA